MIAIDKKDGGIIPETTDLSRACVAPQLQWLVFNHYIFLTSESSKRGCSVYTGSTSASELDWQCFSKTLKK